MNYNNNAVLMNALWLENIFCTLQAPIHHEQLERSGWYRNASTRFSLPFFQLPTVSLIETYSVEKLSLFVSFRILFLARLFHLYCVYPPWASHDFGLSCTVPAPLELCSEECWLQSFADSSVNRNSATFLRSVDDAKTCHYRKWTY